MRVQHGLMSCLVLCFICGAAGAQFTTDLNAELSAKIAYYPSHDTLELRSGDRFLRTDGTVHIINESGKTVQKQPVKFRKASRRKFVKIEPLEPGMYTVRLTGEDYGNAVETRILHQDFDWEGNTLGITDRVVRPFEPIQVEDRTIEVVLRRYHLSGLGLPEQIEARSQDRRSDYKNLLAAPMTLRADGQKISGSGEFIRTTDQKVVYEGEGTHPDVNVKIRSIMEFDGCMRVELTLEPGTEKGILKSLDLEIPIRDVMAPLYHVVKGHPPIRTNPAGSTPGGTGKVWDSSQMRDRRWPGNFKPYIWLGGAARGLSWFADNEKGWVMDWNTTPPCQTLHRNGDTLSLRIHMVQNPITLTESRTITFGLMASPGKPMPEGWRRIGSPEAPQIKFKMGHLFGLNSSFSAKYPRGKDFSPLEKFHRGRLGKSVDVDEFMREWTRKHLHDGMSDKLRERFRRLVRIGVKQGSGLSRKDLFTSYFDEVRSTTLWHDEIKTYWSEWTNRFEVPNEKIFREWDDRPTKKEHLKSRISTGATVPSYRDFACYFAKKWIENGTGVYFDNTFMYDSYNLLNTNAYVRSDGHIQPSAEIWGRRKYFRRILTLHKKHHQPKAPQIMMLHMTNTHVLPYMVWNHVNLDLEWKLPGVKPLQKKFSPALLRAESLGLQTGNIPMAMVKPGKKRTPPGGMSKEKFNAIERTYRAGLMVHEIKYAPNISTTPPPEGMVKFGYGEKGCEVWNYWDDDPPLTVNDDRCKWLLLKRRGQLMVLFCTWNGEPNEIKATLDQRQLGTNVSKVADVNEKKLVDRVRNNSFSFQMDGHGVRLFWLR